MAEEWDTDSTKLAPLLTLSTRYRRLYNVLTLHKDYTEERCTMSKLRRQPLGMKLQTCKYLSLLTIDLTLASSSQHSPDLASLASKTNAIV